MMSVKTTTMTTKMTTEPITHRIARECMGTFFLFQIQDPLSQVEAERMVDSAMEILDWADQTFSLYKPDSEVSKLNRGDLAWEEASVEQIEVRKLCEAWRSKTSGFFDARSGTEYDPSGVVKVWAAARAASFLEANGIRSFTLNAGGDVYLSTELKRGMLTRVGLSAPKSIRSADAGANFVLELAGTGYCSVATSGSAERGEHIWATSDVERFRQVSVIGADYLAADVWATALIAGGSKALENFRAQCQEENLVAVVTAADGSLITTSGFVDLLATI